MASASIHITIRVDNNHIRLAVQKEWTIFQLKVAIQNHCNIPLHQLKLIFGGTELQDDLVLKKCSVGANTILHAIQVQRENVGPHASLNRTIDSIGPVTTSENMEVVSEEDTKRSRFYVYCKGSCKDITPGKLRVRCRICSDDAFELERGPSCWEDVLLSNKIKGRCNRNACEGAFAEFYFRCANHSYDSSDEFVALNLVRTNTPQIPCIICTDINPQVLVFPCDDSHVICTDCFAAYCVNMLNSRRFLLREGTGYTLSCPGLSASCNNAFIKEIHHFLIAGLEQYNRYKNFATEEFVLQNGGVLCPGTNCGNGLMPEDDFNRKLTCDSRQGGCGLVFCRNCRQQYHQGPCSVTASASSDRDLNTLEVNEENARRARWAQENEVNQATIRRTTKPCPGCRAPTEKNSGCNHMTCSRCRFDWCWVCHVAWSRSCQGSHWFPNS